MSDSVTALAGAEATGHVTIRDAGLHGMVSLRGDLADPKLAAACQEVTGCAIPAPLGVTEAGGKAALWMSPDELLLWLPYTEAGQAVAQISARLDGIPHMVTDLSDARQAFDMEGEGWRDLVSKLSPADLRPSAFQPGQIRRSRAAQAPVAIWMRSESQAVLVCFRSVADYVFGLLANGAKNPRAGLY